MAEILVMGAVHGDERPAFYFVNSLLEDPIDGIDVVIANERAAAIGERFIDKELSANTSLSGDTYEDKRLGELIALGQGYKLILDFHTGFLPATYEAWMYPPPDSRKRAIQWLRNEAGIRHAITFDPSWPLYANLPQTVLIEQGLPGAGAWAEWQAHTFPRWRRILGRMVEEGLGNLAPPANAPPITCLQTAKDITREEAHRLDLRRYKELGQYDAVPDEVVAALQLPPGSYKILTWAYRNMSKYVIAEEPGEREYWGNVGREVPVFV